MKTLLFYLLVVVFSTLHFFVKCILFFCKICQKRTAWCSNRTRTFFNRRSTLHYNFDYKKKIVVIKTIFQYFTQISFAKWKAKVSTCSRKPIVKLWENIFWIRLNETQADNWVSIGSLGKSTLYKYVYCASMLLNRCNFSNQ